MVVTATPCSAARAEMRASSLELVMPMLGWPSENNTTWFTCQGWKALNTCARPASRPPPRLVPPPSINERMLAIAMLRVLPSMITGGTAR